MRTMEEYVGQVLEDIESGTLVFHGSPQSTLLFQEQVWEETKGTFIGDLTRWYWLKLNGKPSPQYEKLTSDLYHSVLTWRANGLLVNVSKNDSAAVKKLEGEVKSIKSDMKKLLTGLLTPEAEAAEPQETSSLSMKKKPHDKGIHPGVQ